MLGTELGTALGPDLIESKSKMNISIPTGNRRLCQEENIIAFVVASSVSVAATETVLVAKLDFKLCSKIGTVIDREICKVIVDIKLCTKLGTVVDSACTVVFDIRLVSILGIALGTEQGTTLGSELGATKSKMNICIPTGNLRL